ncbi:MAG TPA: DUF3341 domain-containing protein [Tepidisphaeraceae bacterium]|nr:DUF3341 domain-containing protein [Tepidisphaeraceae bacterium]
MNHAPEPNKIYGLLAEFPGPDELIAAAQRATDAGYRRKDAYTPFPVHGLSEALGLPATRVPLLVLLGGIMGATGGYAMMYYASVISYPLNIGGRALNSWPLFVPITFECMVLCAAGAAVLGMLALNGLPQPYHPLFNVPDFALHASRDKFFLCIESTDPQYDPAQTRSFLEGLGGVVRISEVPR